MQIIGNVRGYFKRQPSSRGYSAAPQPTVQRRTSLRLQWLLNARPSNNPNNCNIHGAPPGKCEDASNVSLDVERSELQFNLTRTMRETLLANFIRSGQGSTRIDGECSSYRYPRSQLNTACKPARGNRKATYTQAGSKLNQLQATREYA
ncbi:unnamed protein product [Prorocentrum cordatum]|uniref:Uncharacterized protein n=1 Tax=Prorocentrum cordatum TaxID=2364126 RepID=A0ABN9U7Q5_9DINO|nr:unnamed protein product [Polarella glacialis]